MLPWFAKDSEIPEGYTIEMRVDSRDLEMVVNGLRNFMDAYPVRRVTAVETSHRSVQLILTLGGIDVGIVIVTPPMERALS